MKNKFFYGTALTLLSSISVHAYETPTMGWSSWNTYGVNINETLIKAQTDAMVDNGLKDAGYRYINIDDGFFGGRDNKGNLLIHPDRFPNGMRTVVDYIHAKGLKAGIYSDAGKNTCASYFNGDKIGVGVGLYGHDTDDMILFFNELNFDFIKVDYCGAEPGYNKDNLELPEKERYTEIHNAIVATGREDVRLNICRWAFPGTWVHDVATSWRISEDIYLGWNSIKSIVGQNLYLSAYATEGKFNDMDMLEVGRGLTKEEDKTHFGMWCMMSSPLLIGCDMTSIQQSTLDLLKNEELIALNQDPLALQAYVIKKVSGAYILTKDVETLNGTQRAVAFYNPTDKTLELSVDFMELDLGGTVSVRDLFAKKDLGTYKGALNTTVPAHGTRIYKLQAEERYERTKYEAETAWLSAYQELTNNQSSETGIYEEADYCSGGAKAGWLGKSEQNDLQWRNVYSRNGGEYILKLTYVSGADRNVHLTVNGENEQVLTLNSGGWSQTAQKEVKVTLKEGYNIIRLYNASDWMPDIDCMDLEKAGSLDSYKHELESMRAKAENLLGTDISTQMSEYLKEVIARTNHIEESEEGYVAAINELRAAIDNVYKFNSSYPAFMELLEQCNENAGHSQSGNALSTFRTQLDEALNQANSTINADELDQLTATLKEQAAAFLKSEDAEPMPGQTWNMEVLLTNPEFTSDAHGWTGSPSYSYGVAEQYNKNFDTYQRLTGLKNGVYTVEVNALYRTGMNDGGQAYKDGTENIPALFYGNGSSQKIMSLYSSPYQGETGIFGQLDLKEGYANSMFAASVCFGQGQYLNSLEVVVTDGTLKIGLQNKGALWDCWCCFDNFRLTYHGENVSAIRETPNEDRKVDVYTVSGVLIKSQAERSKAMESLPQGIYIVNGKKIVKQ